MVTTCHDKYNGNQTCMAAAGKFTQATRMLGGLAFANAQAQSCECVKPETAIPRQEAAVQAFYEKWAPESLGKVDALVAKYAGTSKFPYLMLSLRQKYRESVTELEASEEKIKEHEEAVKKAAQQWADKEAAKAAKGRENPAEISHHDQERSEF
eukprot:TRINITY_DN1351_c0_g1_i1.p3 TRINITY_DN1351_c0_g1~~TRINITY_DN1351_c0_g1_i1.p3  ORF type:complete len:154 (-),score=37.82 TRINITY_DN1351_c0_g1_i1:82-543(-)